MAQRLSKDYLAAALSAVDDSPAVLSILLVRPRDVTSPYGLPREFEHDLQIGSDLPDRVARWFAERTTTFGERADHSSTNT